MSKILFSFLAMTNDHITKYVKFLVRVTVVYKIPYRRAPRLTYQPLGRVRCASKGILHTRFTAYWLGLP